ncbi:MAG: transposase [Chloroflexi bacterium]|nr:transposase [Chloroflexota bacterium]
MNGPIAPQGHQFGINLAIGEVHLLPDGQEASLCGLLMYPLRRETTAADQVCQACARQLYQPKQGGFAMTFERRRSPFLAFRAFAPNPPHDITPAQVREYLAEHPEVKAVRLSGGWMKRPKAVQDEWRKLDYELCEAGIDVYFTIGGTCTWEAGFSDGEAPGPARRPFAPTVTAAAPLDGVTPNPVGFSPPGTTPGEVLHPHGDTDFMDPDYQPAVQTDLGVQAVMTDLDGNPLVDINDPEDAAPDPMEDGPVPAPGGQCNSRRGTDGQPGPVLRQNAAQVEARIREVAARPNIGGYRKIAAALLADHGIDVSHMKVQRVLTKTPVEVG